MCSDSGTPCYVAAVPGLAMGDTDVQLIDLQTRAYNVFTMTRTYTCSGAPSAIANSEVQKHMRRGFTERKEK